MLEASEIRLQSPVCCRHFHDGDATSDPIASLGKTFASLIRKSTQELGELETGK